MPNADGVDELLRRRRAERMAELNSVGSTVPVKRQVSAIKSQAAVLERQRARLAEMRDKEEKSKSTQASQTVVQEQVQARVTAWARKYAGFGLKRMLMSLQEILPSVPAAGLVDTSSPQDVRKAYLKMLRYVHPDKLVSADFELKLQSAFVFGLLKEAFEVFRKRENL